MAKTHKGRQFEPSLPTLAMTDLLPRAWQLSIVPIHENLSLIGIFVLATALGACGDDSGTTMMDPDGMTAVTGTACENYCTNAMANCTGDNEIYADTGSCMAACAAMPVGDPADQSGNTAWCRAYHAGVPAMMEAATHCPHASIASASGVCGTAAEAYCSQATTNCSSLYADKPACMTAAAGMTAGAWNDTTGDTIECRAYHASFPAAADEGMHCPHAMETATGPCM